MLRRSRQPMFQFRVEDGLMSVCTRQYDVIIVRMHVKRDCNESKG